MFGIGIICGPYLDLSPEESAACRRYFLQTVAEACWSAVEDGTYEWALEDGSC